MRRLPRSGGILSLALLAAALAPAPASAQVPPRPVNVRLLTPVSSTSRDPNAAVAAITITSPLHVNPPVPPGCLMLGSVAEQRRASGTTGRAALRLRFDVVQDNNGRSYPVTTHVAAVDNAREHVTPDGLILGLRRIVALPKGGAEGLLLLLAHAHPVLLVTAEGVHLARRSGERPEIAYDEGTDLQLHLTSDLAPDTLECGAGAAEVPADPALLAMVPSWPVQAESGNPPRASDWINLALVGTQAAVEHAFAAAGWLTAARNSLRSDVRTFVAVAKRQGYQTGPVSRLTLNGVAPAMVFQKQTNTFAKRHHIRIWSSSFAVDGRPVWVAAATHDVGITFSKATRHFTHQIDGAIDAERAKVMGDLAFAGAVNLYAMVERPAIPLEIHRADGAWVTTDGEVAVVFLREP